jgi:hypothetical protein
MNDVDKACEAPLNGMKLLLCMKLPCRVNSQFGHCPFSQWSWRLIEWNPRKLMMRDDEEAGRRTQAEGGKRNCMFFCLDFWQIALDIHYLLNWMGLLSVTGYNVNLIPKGTWNEFWIYPAAEGT